MPQSKDPAAIQREKLQAQIRRSAETRDRQLANAKLRAEAAHAARIAPLQAMLSALTPAAPGKAGADG